MKRKITLLLAALMLAAAVAGCGVTPVVTPSPSPTPTPSPTPVDTMDGAPAELLTELQEITNEMLTDEMKLPMTFNSDVTNETSQSAIGVTTEDFDTYIDSASVATAMISSIAYELAIVKCTDETAAATVADLIAEGYDAWKWICVSPENAYVVQSGSYVLLVAASESWGAKLIVGFTDMADGNVGQANLFYIRGQEAGE